MQTTFSQGLVLEFFFHGMTIIWGDIWKSNFMKLIKNKLTKNNTTAWLNRHLWAACAEAHEYYYYSLSLWTGSGREEEEEEEGRREGKGLGEGTGYYSLWHSHFSSPQAHQFPFINAIQSRTPFSDNSSLKTKYIPVDVFSCSYYE